MHNILFKSVSLILVLAIFIVCNITVVTSADGTELQYADSIELDRDFKNSTVISGNTISIPFQLCSFGKYGTQKYYIRIYDSEMNLLIKHSGEFSKKIEIKQYNYSWNCVGQSNGKYYVECFSTYDKSQKSTYNPFYISNNSKAPKITFKSKIVLSVGAEKFISYDIINAKSSDIKWISSNKKIATVNNDGVVYGVSKGKTVIKAKVIKNNKSYYFTASVNVWFYEDIDIDKWYYHSVNYVITKGLISGYKNGNFGPDNYIKKRDFICALAKLSGENLSKYKNKSSYSDVKSESYYANAVKWAKANKIISANKYGKFGVNERLTRTRAVVTLYRYRKNYLKMSTKTEYNKAKKYNDYNKLSSYSRKAYIWALGSGAISAKSSSSLGIKAKLTRARTAKIFRDIAKKGAFKKS